MTKSSSREDTLAGEGWKKQFVASEPRLSEAVDMYEQAGFDVHLEPLPKEPECESCGGTEGVLDDCRICFEGVEDQYKIIFTRPGKGRTEAEEALF